MSPPVRVLLAWVPGLLGITYLVVLVVTFGRLIERVYWDSDAATAGVIGESFGDGTTVLFRYGWFTSLWFVLLTRSLPFHREIWEITPYLLALASVALLSLVSWRIAGPWSAAMTATMAIAVSPFLNYSRVTINYHTATWVATVVMAAFAYLVAESRPRRQVVPAAVAVTMLAGTTLASDLLFAFVGLIPLAISGLCLLLLCRSRTRGALLVIVSVCALPIAWVTTHAMSSAGVEVVSVPVRLADWDRVVPNLVNWIRMVMQLANGDYVIDAAFN